MGIENEIGLAGNVAGVNSPGPEISVFDYYDDFEDGTVSIVSPGTAVSSPVYDGAYSASVLGDSDSSQPINPSNWEYLALVYLSPTTEYGEIMDSGYKYGVWFQPNGVQNRYNVGSSGTITKDDGPDPQRWFWARYVATGGTGHFRWWYAGTPEPDTWDATQPASGTSPFGLSLDANVAPMYVEEIGYGTPVTQP